jgi:hypothetical protein
LAELKEEVIILYLLIEREKNEGFLEIVFFGIFYYGLPLNETIPLIIKIPIFSTRTYFSSQTRMIPMFLTKNS